MVAQGFMSITPQATLSTPVFNFRMDFGEMISLSKPKIFVTVKAYFASRNCAGKRTVMTISGMRLQSLDRFKFLAALLASNRTMGGGAAPNAVQVLNVEQLDLFVKRAIT